MDVTLTINDDGLVHIFRFLEGLPLLNASCTCKRWHELAQQVIDSTVTLALAEVYTERNLRLFERIQSDEYFRKRIHRIVVRDWHHLHLEEIKGASPWLDGEYFSTTYQGSRAEWWLNTRKQIDELAKCLRLLRLARFTWAAIPPLPQILASTLNEVQPACKIEIVRNGYSDRAALWAYTPFLNHRGLSILLQLPTIAALDLIIAPTDTAVLASLGALIESHCALQVLKLKALSHNWPGSPTNWAWGMNVDRMKDPKLFLVQSMKWLRDPLLSQNRKLRLRELDLSNFCICQNDEDGIKLADLIDVNGVVSLSLTCFGFLNNCTGAIFRNLKDLSLGFREGHVLERGKCTSDWDRETVQKFLQDCRCLRSLHLVDRADILSEGTLKAIGNELMSVDVHKSIPLEPKQQTHTWAIPYSVADDCEYPEHLIKLMSRHCGRLEQLSINLRTHWPEFYAGLEQIASKLPTLIQLRVYRMQDPYKLADGTYDPMGFRKASMEAIWSQYHRVANNPLDQLTLQLQNVVEAGLYETRTRKPGIREATYVSTRDPDIESVRSKNATVSMLQLEDAERANMETAPRDVSVSFRGRYGSLMRMFIDGPKVASE